ncbi:MAG: GNAT family N-acetyltransferase [Acidimicrobiales bacterium]
MEGRPGRRHHQPRDERVLPRDVAAPPGRRTSAAVVATMHGSDVGYILGGVRDHRYRGLQLSYAAEAGSLSLGHLLQRHELHRMAADGVATYDMGMDMAYKQRMADRSMTSVMLVVRRDVTGYVRHP